MRDYDPSTKSFCEFFTAKGKLYKWHSDFFRLDLYSDGEIRQITQDTEKPPYNRGGNEAGRAEDGWLEQ
jgi:hypothetical protein